MIEVSRSEAFAEKPLKKPTVNSGEAFGNMGYD